MKIKTRYAQYIKEEAVQNDWAQTIIQYLRNNPRERIYRSGWTTYEEPAKKYWFWSRGLFNNDNKIRKIEVEYFNGVYNTTIYKQVGETEYPNQKGIDGGGNYGGGGGKSVDGGNYGGGGRKSVGGGDYGGDGGNYGGGGGNYGGGNNGDQLKKLPHHDDDGYQKIVPPVKKDEGFFKKLRQKLFGSDIPLLADGTEGKKSEKSPDQLHNCYEDLEELGNRNLFYAIAKISHPDVLEGDKKMDQKYKDEKKSIFIEAQNFYKNQNREGLLKIARDLGLEC